MDKIIFRKKSSIELNKAILYDHNNPKEHSDIENCFIIKYMTYWELCDKEIKNDEWTELISSEKYLELEEKIYCGICNKKYDKDYRYDSNNQG